MSHERRRNRTKCQSETPIRTGKKKRYQKGEQDNSQRVPQPSTTAEKEYMQEGEAKATFNGKARQGKAKDPRAT
jgi:hypothetical protein